MIAPFRFCVVLRIRVRSGFFLRAECAALGADVEAAEPSPMVGFLRAAYFAYAHIAVLSCPAVVVGTGIAAHGAGTIF